MREILCSCEEINQLAFFGVFSSLSENERLPLWSIDLKLNAELSWGLRALESKSVWERCSEHCCEYLETLSSSFLESNEDSSVSQT
jgi:hypothetical protein